MNPGTIARLLEILSTSGAISADTLKRRAGIRRDAYLQACIDELRVENGIREWNEGGTKFYEMKWS